MDRYALPAAKRFIVRLIALIFFALGAIEVGQAPIPFVAPQLIAPSWSSTRGLVGDPEALLPQEARVRLATDTGARARFLTRLAEPAVRTRHLLLSLAIDLPVIVILGGMGMALWRSTRRTADAVEQGLPWLMAVGWAAAGFALSFPVFDGMRTVLLLDGIMPTPGLMWYDPATGGTTYILLLIAAGILAATWTISAGLKARADMAEIV